jgi:hypothetical protein
MAKPCASTCLSALCLPAKILECCLPGWTKIPIRVALGVLALFVVAIVLTSFSRAAWRDLEIGHKVAMDHLKLVQSELISLVSMNNTQRYAQLSNYTKNLAMASEMKVLQLQRQIKLLEGLALNPLGTLYNHTLLPMEEKLWFKCAGFLWEAYKYTPMGYLLHRAGRDTYHQSLAPETKYLRYRRQGKIVKSRQTTEQMLQWTTLILSTSDQISQVTFDMEGMAQGFLACEYLDSNSRLLWPKVGKADIYHMYHDCIVLICKTKTWEPESNSKCANKKILHLSTLLPSSYEDVPSGTIDF